MGFQKGEMDLGHDLNLEEIGRLPDLLQSPILVMSGTDDMESNSFKKRSDNTLMIFLNIKRPQREVFAVIKMDCGNRTKYHSVITAYSKDIESVFNIIQDKAFTNEIYYYDKEELDYWLKEVGKSSLKSIIEKNSLYSSEDIKKIGDNRKASIADGCANPKKNKSFCSHPAPEQKRVNENYDANIEVKSGKKKENENINNKENKKMTAWTIPPRAYASNPDIGSYALHVVLILSLHP